MGSEIEWKTGNNINAKNIRYRNNSRYIGYRHIYVYSIFDLKTNGKLGKIMTQMYTYEFECPACQNKVKMELHQKLETNIHCICKAEMDMKSFLQSPDIRAE